MIDLILEKQRHLTTQEVYDILDFSMQAAEDNGFLNKFIYQRALYEYSVLVLFPEHKEKYAPMVAENINSAWDVMLKDGILDELIEKYEADLQYLADQSVDWFDDFSTYLHSARGLLSSFQEVTGQITHNSLDSFLKVAKETGVADVLDIAEHWGMDRELPQEKKNFDIETSDDSLFHA